MRKSPVMTTSKTDEIKRLIRETNKNEISKELVLDSLRENGIHDLDAFIEHSIEASNGSQARSLGELLPELVDLSPEDARVELLFGKKAQSAATNHKYAEPKLPFVHGGSHHDPSDISRFNGKVLHYVWDPELAHQGFLKAVTDPAEYRDFLNASRAPRGNEVVPENHVPGVGHTFFQHINFGGYVLNLDYRHALPDLTRVTMSGFWFWATSWNDQISSLRTGSGPVTVAANAMRPFVTGATTTFPPNTSVPFVGPTWNDQVSAILG